MAKDEERKLRLRPRKGREVLVIRRLGTRVC